MAPGKAFAPSRAERPRRIAVSDGYGEPRSHLAADESLSQGPPPVGPERDSQRPSGDRPKASPVSEGWSVCVPYSRS